MKIPKIKIKFHDVFNHGKQQQSHASFCSSSSPPLLFFWPQSLLESLSLPPSLLLLTWWPPHLVGGGLLSGPQQVPSTHHTPQNSLDLGCPSPTIQTSPHTGLIPQEKPFAYGCFERRKSWLAFLLSQVINIALPAFKTFNSRNECEMHLWVVSCLGCSPPS